MPIEDHYTVVQRQLDDKTEVKTFICRVCGKNVDRKVLNLHAENCTAPTGGTR